MDADTRARLISLGIDPDKQEVPSSTAPTLADHLTALAELLKPAVAPEAAPVPAPAVEVEPETKTNIIGITYVPAPAPEPTPAPVAAPAAAVIEAYRPIEQVYTAPEAAPLPEPVKADAEPFADPDPVRLWKGEEWPVEAPAPAEAAPLPEPVNQAAPVVPAEPTINYSPSGRYVEGGIEYVSFSNDTLANDPQVVEFKKNGTAMATQVDGNHYVKCVIQPLDYIMANKLGFVEGNIVKYATRWQDKDGVVDLKKARDYLDKLIAYVEAAS